MCGIGRRRRNGNELTEVRTMYGLSTGALNYSTGCTSTAARQKSISRCCMIVVGGRSKLSCSRSADVVLKM